jgi:type IV pilus assembly protein PilA
MPRGSRAVSLKPGAKQPLLRVIAVDRRPLTDRARADERGFSLVEILVVVLIVAVLAAIALPLYVNQRSKAQDAEAKADGAVAAQALTIWHQDHETYEGAGIEELARIEPEIGNAPNLTITAGEEEYTITVRSRSAPSGGGPFVIEHDETGTTRTCAHPGHGGCPSDGRW